MSIETPEASEKIKNPENKEKQQNPDEARYLDYDPHAIDKINITNKLDSYWKSLDKIKWSIENTKLEQNVDKKAYKNAMLYVQIDRYQKEIDGIKQVPNPPTLLWNLDKICTNLKTEIMENVQDEKQFNAMLSELFGKISNKDFLKYTSKDQRLEKITKPPKEAKDVKSGDDIRFTFTFENKLNENLYLKTTAWQVLPSEVREVKDEIWNIYTRNWLEWEFFDKWNRLIIHDWTIITPSKVITGDQLKIEEENNRKRLADSWYKEGTENYDVARMANDRWLDIQTAINLFWWMFKWNVTWKEQQDLRNAEIEELLTELERTKWYFKDDYPSNDFEKDWKLTHEFLSYYINQTQWGSEKRNEYVKTLWIDEQILEKYSRKNIEKKYSWYKELSDEEKLEISKMDPKKLESFEKPSFWMKFEPWSKEAQELFTYAAMKAGLPKEWWSNEWLHDILKNESKGIVWIPNYKMVEKHITWEDLKKVNPNISWENVAWAVWVSSTATWLWQLTLSNEKYLPNWRASIWIPLDEAIWMLRYIEDRYGSPDIAYSVYGKKGNYNHPTKWAQVKQFKEWY